MPSRIVDLKNGATVLQELFKVKSFEDFLPSSSQPREVNTMRTFRLVMVASIGLSLVASSVAWMALPVVFLVAYVVYANVEGYRTAPEAARCTLPTEDNPYMNALYGDEPQRPPACKHVANLSKEMYYKNLPRDADDLHNTRATDWAFYTTASTQVPNDQDAFLEYLGAPAKPDWCKEAQEAA